MPLTGMDPPPGPTFLYSTIAAQHLDLLGRFAGTRPVCQSPQGPDSGHGGVA